MADKKITDLQLRSNVDDDVNVPIDDGIETYRTTAPQWVSYILSVARLALIRNAIYRAVVTTDAVGAADETMVLSGASFTSTLPTAVGVAGKRYKFIHAGTSYTNIYTLATTSSQTIGGFASAAIKLYNAGEVVEIESNGANWIIVGRYCPQVWEAFTPTTQGFGTITSAFFAAMRSATTLSIWAKFTCGTTAASEARVSFPGSLTTAASGKIGAIMPVGIWTRDTNVTFTTGNVIIDASKAYLNFGKSIHAGDVSGGGLLTANLGTDNFSNSDPVGFFANSIPITEFVI